MNSIANTPQPPYYSVIFTSRRTDFEGSEYAAMAEQMVQLASEQDGYLGVESVRDANGLGITVSYWKDLDAIKRWQENVEHRSAQKWGREKWYQQFAVRICKVEREYHFEKGAAE